ncbi:hypothetical protein DBR37_14115 [Herminiimonas sp. KBW02]|nr:hypothetical protein DBR37_14115 [Herminiimonas sp. KBW02]
MTKGNFGTAGSQIEVSTLNNVPQGSYYPSNIPGIGLIWRVKLVAVNFAAGLNVNLGTGVYNSPATGITNATTVYRQEVYVEVVRSIGRVGNGTLILPTENLLRFRYNCGASCGHWNIGINGSLQIEAIPTCAVQVANQSVFLKQVLVKTFTGQGSTSPAHPFSIDLACSGGGVGSIVNAYVTFTDSTNPNNQSKVLSLSGTQKASGVGVQIKHGDTILGYGPDSSQIPNTNQWFAGTISYAEGGRLLRIPLTASYVQTAATAAGIRAGPADAKATFNVTYN